MLYFWLIAFVSIRSALLFPIVLKDGLIQYDLDSTPRSYDQDLLVTGHYLNDRISSNPRLYSEVLKPRYIVRCSDGLERQTFNGHVVAAAYDENGLWLARLEHLFVRGSQGLLGTVRHKVMSSLGLSSEAYISFIYVTNSCDLATSARKASDDVTHFSPSFLADNGGVLFCTSTECTRASLDGALIKTSGDKAASYSYSVKECSPLSGSILRNTLSVIHPDNIQAEYIWKYPYAAWILESEMTPNDKCKESSLSLLTEAYMLMAKKPELIYSRRYTQDGSLAVFRIHWGIFSDVGRQLGIPKRLLREVYEASKPQFEEIVYKSKVYDRPFRSYLKIRRNSRFWASNRPTPNNFVSAYVLGRLQVNPTPDLVDFMMPQLASFSKTGKWYYYLQPNNIGWVDPYSNTPVFLAKPFAWDTPYSYRFFELKTYLYLLDIYYPSVVTQSEKSQICSMVQRSLYEYPVHMRLLSSQLLSNCNLRKTSQERAALPSEFLYRLADLL